MLEKKTCTNSVKNQLNLPFYLFISLFIYLFSLFFVYLFRSVFASVTSFWLCCFCFFKNIFSWNLIGGVLSGSRTPSGATIFHNWWKQSWQMCAKQTLLNCAKNHTNHTYQSGPFNTASAQSSFSCFGPPFNFLCHSSVCRFQSNHPAPWKAVFYFVT